MHCVCERLEQLFWSLCSLRGNDVIRQFFKHVYYVLNYMYLYISQRSIAYTIAWSKSFGTVWVYHVIMHLQAIYSEVCHARVGAGFFKWWISGPPPLFKGARVTEQETEFF